MSEKNNLSPFLLDEFYYSLCIFFGLFKKANKEKEKSKSQIFVWLTLCYFLF